MLTKKEKTELEQIENELCEISDRLLEISKKKNVSRLGFQTVETLGIQCYNHASLLGAVVANSERK